MCKPACPRAMPALCGQYFRIYRWLQCRIWGGCPAEGRGGRGKRDSPYGESLVLFIHSTDLLIAYQEVCFLVYGSRCIVSGLLMSTSLVDLLLVISLESGCEFIKIFFDVCISVAVPVLGTVVHVWVQPVGQLPGIGHAIMVSILGRCSRC